MSRRGSIGFLLHPGEQPAVQAAIARAQACDFGVWTALERPEAAVEEHAGDAKLLVTVGGDGTFLYGARLAAPRAIPVMGVNRGRLGFLNDVEVDKLPDAISRFAHGDYRTQRRSLIDVELAGASAASHALALNEVVVRARDVERAVQALHADFELDQPPA